MRGWRDTTCPYSKHIDVIGYHAELCSENADICGHRATGTCHIWYRSPMHKTTVYLDEQTLVSLRQLAQSGGHSQAELIRNAVADFTRRVGTPRPTGIGSYRSGRSDVSSKAEKLLRQAARSRRWR